MFGTDVTSATARKGKTAPTKWDHLNKITDRERERERERERARKAFTGRSDVLYSRLGTWMFTLQEWKVAELTCKTRQKRPFTKLCQIKTNNRYLL
jgi:hypothetical protein